MGRQRNPARDKAKEIWLSSEPDTIKLKEIADQLGYPENAIRKWKSEDKWELERSEIKRSASKKKEKSSHKEPRKRGPPKGNTNALGHGAPIGNQNAFKHGGYSEILFDTMDEKELELISKMPSDEEQLLIDEIQILTIRERRILLRIEEHKKTPISVASTTRIDHKREFDSAEDKKLYYERIREKVCAKERLPGREYDVHNSAEASYSIILKLEEALTRCQAQKQRDIESLIKLRQATGSKHGALADDWITGVMESLEENDANSND